MSFNLENIVDNNLQEQIIGIDVERKSTFPVEKLEAHVKNIPHVAVSVFVFKGPQLLLQKRADTKYHSGGLWANTVCSHPRWQESTNECAHRRMEEELGWSTALQEFGQIDYQAQVGELFENEKVACFFGEYGNQCNIELFNRNEVSAVQWIDYSKISNCIAKNPCKYAEWFKIYMHEHFSLIKNLL